MTSMLFNAAHRQAVHYYLHRELNVASVLLRIASETPASPMNTYLTDRLHDVGKATRELKEIPSGTWTVASVIGVMPDSLEAELMKLIQSLPAVAA